MIPDFKFAELAAALLEKTKNRSVIWHSDAGIAQSFLLRLANSQIRIRYQSPPTEPDFIEMGVADSQGRWIARWEVTAENPSWKLVWDLLFTIQKSSGPLAPVFMDIDNLIDQKGA